MQIEPEIWDKLMQFVRTLKVNRHPAAEMCHIVGDGITLRCYHTDGIVDQMLSIDADIVGMCTVPVSALYPVDLIGQSIVMDFGKSNLTLGDGKRKYLVPIASHEYTPCYDMEVVPAEKKDSEIYAKLKLVQWVPGLDKLQTHYPPWPHLDGPHLVTCTMAVSAHVSVPDRTNGDKSIQACCAIWPGMMSSDDDGPSIGISVDCNSTYITSHGVGWLHSVRYSTRRDYYKWMKLTERVMDGSVTVSRTELEGEVKVMAKSTYLTLATDSGRLHLLGEGESVVESEVECEGDAGRELVVSPTFLLKAIKAITTDKVTMQWTPESGLVKIVGDADVYIAEMVKGRNG